MATIHLLSVSRPLPEGLQSAAVEARKVWGLSAEDHKGRRTCYSDMIVNIAEVSGQQGTYINLLQRNEAVYDTFHAAFCVLGFDGELVTTLSILDLGKLSIWSGSFKQWSNTLVLNMRKDNKELKFWNMFYHLFYQTGLNFLWSKYKLGTINELTYFV